MSVTVAVVFSLLVPLIFVRLMIIIFVLILVIWCRNMVTPSSSHASHSTETRKADVAIKSEQSKPKQPDSVLSKYDVILTNSIFFVVLFSAIDPCKMCIIPVPSDVHCINFFKY